MSGKGKEGRVPQIRFAGFTDPWEQRKFSDLVEVCSGRDYKHLHEGAVPVYGTGGYMTSVDEALSYDKDAIGIGRKGTIDKPYRLRAPFWTVDTLFYCIPYPGIDINFALCCFSNVDWKNKDESTGLPSLSKEAINEAFVCLPSADEQIAIGHHFTNLDNLITLHQRKYDKLCAVKKSMLDKMFPKGGSLYPEIRFAGFTDPWEQRKLGAMTAVLSAARVHKEEWQTEGVPFYRSSDVMSAFNGTQNEKVFISQELFDRLSSQSGAPQKGDVLVTGGGSVGTPYIVPDNKPLYTKDADLIWIKRHAMIDPEFLYSFFASPIFRAYIQSISHVGTIAHYTIEQVKETPLTMPCSIVEQKAIGSFLSNLDHLITLHQRKLELLRNIKKAMLDKMFA